MKQAVNSCGATLPMLQVPSYRVVAPAFAEGLAYAPQSNVLWLSPDSDQATTTLTHSGNGF